MVTLTPHAHTIHNLHLPTTTMGKALAAAFCASIMAIAIMLLASTFIQGKYNYIPMSPLA